MTATPPGGAMSVADRRELLRIARVTLIERVTAGRIPPGTPHRASLRVPAALFVTLRRGPTLRGCIGTTAADTPIYRAVQEMTEAAATRDPRFPAVGADELGGLTIEISVLGRRERIAGPAEVVVGRHGVAIAARGRHGLLLPQVAPEAGWDAATFVARLCAKAGLPPDAWRHPDAEFERFAAEVFAEDDPSPPPAVAG